MQENSATQENYRPTHRPTIHLLMGLPGAGKSTLAQIIEELTGAVRISSDEYRLKLFPSPSFSQIEHDSLYQKLDEITKKALIKGHDVVYDANLNRLSHRTEKYVLAEKFHAHVRLWWVRTPEELAKKRRIDEQDHALIPAGETPSNMFDRIAAIMEFPTSTERYTEIDGRDIKKEHIKELLNA